MRKPEPIEVRYLFPELYLELIDLLRNLSRDEWYYSTSSSKWNVKDIVAHLIDTDLRRISFQRDKFNPPQPGKPVGNYQQLVDYLNHLNNSWIEVSKRLSPGILIDLLNYTCVEIPKLLNSLDMNAEALFSVSWAGEDKSKNWFDIAREYTEKWYHQQQIREAVGKPLLVEQRWIHPIIDTFVRGLPHIYQNVFCDVENATVVFHVEDLPGGDWSLVKNNSWELFTGSSPDYNSKVTMNTDTAWRMFSKNISKDIAKQRTFIEGNNTLGLFILELTTFMK
ncbi:MAG: maleylpyruvate isomerase N-terminal domain-containing protein [bacterium]